MSATTDDPTDGKLAALMDAGAAVLDLDIEAEWRPAVLANLETTMRFALSVASFPLPDTVDPANIFRVPGLGASQVDEAS